MRPMREILLPVLLSFSFGHSSSTSSPYHYKPSQTPTLKSGLRTVLETKWNNAAGLALLEQAVEDYNAELVATAPDPISANFKRRLIVLPLDERFDPPMGVFSHGHVQTGDKMSMPRNFLDAIMKSNAEVPWLFEISRVEGITSSPATSHSPNSNPQLRTLVGGAIDFRSPSNYIFLPQWMILALNLKPFDAVDVAMKTDVPPGSHVRLRPHSSDFLKITNHQAVLETELKHYSALTAGSVIPFDYAGKRFFFDVVDLRSAPRGEKVGMVKVQDCDIAAEFVRAKDQVKNSKTSKKGGDKQI